MRHVAFIWRYKPYGTEKKSKKASCPRIFSSSRKLCLRIASKSDSQSPCQRHNYVCTMCRYPRRRCRSIPMKFRARLRLPRNMLRNRRQHQYSAIAFIHCTHTHTKRERERESEHTVRVCIYVCVFDHGFHWCCAVRSESFPPTLYVLGLFFMVAMAWQWRKVAV